MSDSLPPGAAASEPPRALRWTGFGAFVLIGWAGILLPSLIRDVKADFRQDDIAIGLIYFAFSLAYFFGSVFGGFLAERFGRRVVLATAFGLMVAGLAGSAVSPAWLLFVVAYVVLGVGAGAVDSGVNALFLDLYAHRPSGALSRLHLFFSIGALLAPVSVGLLVGGGLPWRVIFLGTAIATVAVGILLWSEPMPDGRHHAAAAAPADEAAGTEPGPARGQLGRGLPIPLIALAIAIGCYVPSEMGVSNWLVRYFDEVPLETATLALTLFWTGLALGRFVSSLIADRMGPVRFAATWSCAAGVLIIAAVFAPSVPFAMALFAVAGFASGPIYPMIMAIGGSFYPGRSSRVSGILAGAAVAGSVVYPPLMGYISEAAGLEIAMIGAGAFGIAAAVAIVVAGSLGRGLTQPRVPAASAGSTVTS